jgi:cell filamentation protein
VPALDRLPERLRRCVDQAIAAEVLEGWRPAADRVDALVSLAGDEITFDDYLAAHRARYPTRPPRREKRRLFRRRIPYLIPGTMLLRNNFDADTHAMLADLEFVATAGRIVGWHRRLVDGDVGADDLDFRSVHRHVFSDVYPWAGDYRITELRLGDELFASLASVEQTMARVEATARSMVDGADADQFARLYADYNYAHPFREGNGRTGTTMLHTVATLCGRRLDLSAFSRNEWYGASRESMPSRQDGQADHRPFIPLFTRALG